MTPPLVSSLSIPGLLSSLQNEWDDMMLTTYQLKSALDSTRQVSLQYASYFNISSHSSQKL